MSYRNRIIERTEVKAGDLTDHAGNWRVHPEAQKRGMVAILEEVGIVDALTVYRNDADDLTIIDGHLRKNIDPAQMWPVDVLDVDDDEADKILATKDPLAAMAETERAQMEALMAGIEAESEAMEALLADIAEREGVVLDGDEAAPPPDEQPNPRNLPIDVIYTLQGADCTCCLAVMAGLKYGIQSASYRLCPYTGQLSGRHDVAFIDNDYLDYDHTVHLAAVTELHPKYATVRDIMSKAQCHKAGISFYELEQILDWAEELNEHADHVIVIPKYDCLDKISDKFILGYSIPTSHGGTPLPIEAFRHRRVHLLGGSWRKQLNYMAALGDDVISLDTNYVQRQAKMLGAACDPSGNEFQMQDVGYGYLTNVRYAALALSFGAIGSKINQLYAS